MSNAERPAVTHHDVVVVGAGIAGLVAALTAAEPGGPVRPRVALITAGRLAGGCSRLAQGGIAAALGDDDSTELHLADTLAAGRGLCDERAVRVLVEEGPRRLSELADWGVRFDVGADGRWQLGREAAHSRARVVHGGGDATGLVIVSTLAERARSAGIEVVEGAELLGLLSDADAACAGADVVIAGAGLRRLVAPATVLATGGAGALWARTTNPPGATGGGVAMAFDLGAEVASMEMIQFHPTALAGDGPALLLSETLRGEGSLVVDGEGWRFLLDCDPRAELAPRDVVAAAIWERLSASPDASVLLDTRPLGPGAAKRFPTIQAALSERGLLLGRDLLPIAPAAHYTIGGVRTDLEGGTSVPGLFAAGEVASTGVHGANRLASNSLLEGAVFGRRAGRAARTHAAEAPRPRLDEPAPLETPVPADGARAEALLGTVREAMWRGAGLVREAGGLARLRAELDAAGDEAGMLSFPHSVRVGAATAAAALVSEAAQLREETRGAHRRCDHPGDDEAQRGVWVLARNRGPRLDRHA